MISKNIPLIVILGISLLLISMPLAYGDDNSIEHEDHQLENDHLETGPMAYTLQFFRKTISRADGHRCMMYPSCSHYSAQAFEKHGFIKGWIMTSDRLLRCGRDEKNISENIIIDEKTYVFDPLQRNDFWWSHP
jgi:putative component of membrane protein insertase Oxa1/YidC/SpoIIIJ protein YidD